MRAVCIGVLFCLWAFASVSGQSRYASIQGKVVDNSSAGIEAATVALFRRSDSAYVKAAVTTQAGDFLLDNIKPGIYYLNITKLGCSPLYSPAYTLLADHQIKTGAFKLEKSTTGLNTVVVTDRKSYIENRADKTVLNVSKSILATGVSVFDVLSNAPGVKAQLDGGLSLKAGQDALILVNGKPVSGARIDINTVLRGLQSESIDRIELIPNPPANFEANGTGGVINIILKKNKYEGLNGSAQVSGGMGRYGKYNESLNLNYRHSKLNIYGTIGSSYNKSYQDIQTSRTIGASSVSTITDNVQAARYFYYNGGIDYTIDSVHTLGFNVRGFYITDRMNQQANSTLSYAGRQDTTLITHLNSGPRFGNYNYNLNYSGQLGHSGQTLSADADYTDINRHQQDGITGTLDQYLAAGNREQTNLIRRTVPVDIQIKSLKADYVDPITKEMSFRAGLKYSDVDSHYHEDFDQLVNQTYVSNAALSGDYSYKEKISSAYVNLQQQAGAFNYYAGVRLEHTRLDQIQSTIDQKQDYTNLFPSVQLSYLVNTQHQLSLNYNYRITRPDYDNLNPLIVYYQDRYNFQTGNRFLKPAYGNYVQVVDTYLNKYVATLYTEQVRDFFGFTFFMQNPVTKINVTTRYNIKQASTYGFRVNAPANFTSWWNVNFYFDASYQRYQDYAGLMNRGTSDFSFNLFQHFSLNKKIALELNGHYESATFYGTDRFLPYYYLNGGVSGQINDAWSITLTANDVFNTNRDRYSSTYNLDLSGYRKRETQVVNLTVAYHFGKSSVKSSRQHTAGNADEVRRAPSN